MSTDIHPEDGDRLTALWDETSDIRQRFDQACADYRNAMKAAVESPDDRTALTLAPLVQSVIEIIGDGGDEDVQRRWLAELLETLTTTLKKLDRIRSRKRGADYLAAMENARAAIRRPLREHTGRQNLDVDDRMVVEIADDGRVTMQGRDDTAVDVGVIKKLNVADKPWFVADNRGSGMSFWEKGEALFWLGRFCFFHPESWRRKPEPSPSG